MFLDVCFYYNGQIMQGSVFKDLKAHFNFYKISGTLKFSSDKQILLILEFQVNMEENEFNSYSLF